MTDTQFFSWVSLGVLLVAASLLLAVLSAHAKRGWVKFSLFIAATAAAIFGFFVNNFSGFTMGSQKQENKLQLQIRQLQLATKILCPPAAGLNCRVSWGEAPDGFVVVVRFPDRYYRIPSNGRVAVYRSRIPSPPQQPQGAGPPP